VITNGMVIPNYSSKELYEKMHAQGVTMYGQMTAGSYCCTPLPPYRCLCYLTLTHVFILPL
jgi:hypothetical protein